MLDSFNRDINYLRLSITTRCQWHCLYCRPKLSSSEEEAQTMELSLAQIMKIARFAVGSFGINKIRLTGGEPLLHPDIISIVSEIASLPGIKEVNLTTNGLRLAALASHLKKAGLTRVNVSVDTLNPSRLAKLVQLPSVAAGEKALDQLIRGIAAASAEGLNPVKINSVSGPWTDNEDILSVRRFCADHQLKHQIIKQMDLDEQSFAPVLGGQGGHCDSCNRLRVTSEGQVLPCLMSKTGVQLPLLDLSEANLKAAFERALALKPKDGHHSSEKDISSQAPHLYSSFIQIGG